MIVRRMAPSEGAWLRNSGELNELRRQMQSLVGGMEAAFLSSSGAGVFPAVNVTQDENNLYVRAELPGMKANELQVTAVKNRLSLSGTRQILSEDETVSYHRRERAGGYFSRSVVLPLDFQADKVAADYVDGILTVTLPRTPEAKPKQIQVKTF
jgi:HSP20 family protein